VKDIVLIAQHYSPLALSFSALPGHGFERTAGPVIKMIESLANDPAKLAAFRTEMEALISEYFRDNTVRQDYLLTRVARFDVSRLYRGFSASEIITDTSGTGQKTSYGCLTQSA